MTGWPLSAWAIRRRGGAPGSGSWQLAIQACTAAMDDAGMTPADIDGVSVLWGVAGPAPGGLDIIDPMDLGYTLGISPLNWFAAPSPSPAYVGAALQGIAAIRSGFAHTVLDSPDHQPAVELGRGAPGDGRAGTARW